MTYTLHHGDCLGTLRTMPDNSVDSIVTDPPYGLSFMGKRWDYDVPSIEIWAECLRVLKPGGHLLAFAGTRTQHRMAVRIEDAGFEIRDMIAWTYGSGFPKSMDVSKAIDKMDATEARRARQLRFTEWVRSTGLTSAEIDRITGTNMGGHYTTAASQPAVATREHFETLRPHFGGDVPEWVEQLVDERTVESENFKRREVLAQGTAKLAQGRLNAETAGSGGFGYGAEYNITAPATEAARQWQGWGTALKPALEPITVARKPLVSTVAANVLQHGTGALNIDGCRVGTEGGTAKGSKPDGVGNGIYGAGLHGTCDIKQLDAGRWPANLIHDGSEPAELLGEAARFFQQCKSGYNEAWHDLNLPQENANTAEQSLSQQRQAAVSALVLAVNSALPEGLLCSGLSTAPSTTATGIELRQIADIVTQTIQSIDSRFWHESKPARLTLSLNHASDAEIQRLTDTTTITVSRWKSDGSVDPVTFSITQRNLEAGERDCAPSTDGKRFIYCAKASKRDRDEGLEGFEVKRTGGMQATADGSMLTGSGNERTTARANIHPTVKPTDLMRYLCRLVTPPGGVVLDPFMGSGSTGKAARLEGFRFVGCELSAEYLEIARARIEAAAKASNA